MHTEKTEKQEEPYEYLYNNYLKNWSVQDHIIMQKYKDTPPTSGPVIYRCPPANAHHC